MDAGRLKDAITKEEQAVNKIQEAGISNYSAIHFLITGVHVTNSWLSILNLIPIASWYCLN